MKRIVAVSMLFCLLVLCGCELVGDIFKAGVGVGVFLVVAVIIGIAFLLGKVFGK